MKTFLTLPNQRGEPLPPEFAADDIRYAPALVRRFVAEFTSPGECVLDPFAGFGATLFEAEALGRPAYGIELDAAKAAYIRARLAHPERLIHGDARQLAEYGLPAVQLVMTSPPFMGFDDITDPLTDYHTRGAGYRAYLRQLRGVFAQLRALLDPSGRLVIEASNLKRAGRVTTLAWDIAAEASQVLHFEGEVIIGWDSYGYGYDHSYCLVFSAL
ncbi:MAG: DNA methyltransferase [Chloroflexota bacterium]